MTEHVKLSSTSKRLALLLTGIIVLLLVFHPEWIPVSYVKRKVPTKTVKIQQIGDINYTETKSLQKPKIFRNVGEMNKSSSEIDRGERNKLCKYDIDNIRNMYATLLKIKENCKNRSIPTDWDFQDNFSKPRLLIAKTDWKILYTSNPKTGSTSFKKFFFHLDGEYVKKTFHDIPSVHYAVVKRKQFFGDQTNFERYTKIVVIRNPILRLISAFRNKQLEDHLYFRPKLNMTDKEQFAHFVRTRISWKTETDVHLAPQWKQIDICRFPYDFVIQFEEAYRYYDTMQKLTKTTDVKFPGSKVEIGKSDHDSIYYLDEFFNSLNREEQNIVYQRYKMDFEILGYTRYGENLFPYLRYTNILDTTIS